MPIIVTRTVKTARSAKPIEVTFVMAITASRQLRVPTVPGAFGESPE